MSTGRGVHGVDTPRPARRKSGHRWAIAAAVVAALLLGLGLGSTIGPSSDEYDGVQAELATSQNDLGTVRQNLGVVQDQVEEAQDSASAASSSASAAVASADARQSELEAQEAAVAARETAVAVVEQTIEDNSIEQGTWTVGVDMAPGTYRTAEAVTSGDCYWAITVTGSNGSDIVENDIVSGGFPTVTVSEGQTFENNRCGTFVLQ